MKKIIAMLLTLSMMTLSFASCSSSDDDSDTTSADTTSADTAQTPDAESDLAYIVDKGTLIVGITDYPPMDYQDANGDWIGFDADMAKAFGAKLGVDVIFQVVAWENKAIELAGKTVDCIWNGMTLNDEVMAAMDCTDPYCKNQQIIIVKADDAEKYQTLESCADLTFAVEEGSAGENVANENGFTTNPVIDQATALLEVKSGSSDAAIIDSLMAGAMVGEGTAYADLTYTVGMGNEVFTIGCRRGSDMVAALNSFLAAAKADGSLMNAATTYGVQAAVIVD